MLCVWQFWGRRRENGCKIGWTTFQTYQQYSTVAQKRILPGVIPTLTTKFAIVSDILSGGIHGILTISDHIWHSIWHTLWIFVACICIYIYIRYILTSFLAFYLTRYDSSILCSPCVWARGPQLMSSGGVAPLNSKDLHLGRWGKCQL